MQNNSKQSVLLVENDSAVLEHLSKRFKKLGMYVITARDGYEGYIRACKEHPDFIVSETLLSNINGFRMSRLLKFDERYKDIVITLITKNELNIVEEMHKASGADNILQKPFKFSQLVDHLKILTPQQ